MKNAVSQKESKAAMAPTPQPVMKKATAPVEGPGEDRDVQAMPPQPKPYIDEVGVAQIDGFLRIVGQSEELGIIDYKGAFHKLVDKLRENVKTK